LVSGADIQGRAILQPSPEGNQAMYAIIRASGHQYRVEKDSIIRLDKLALASGDKFETSDVLFVQNDGETKVGKPFIDGARVSGTVLEHRKGKKIRVFKYKSKKNYRRRYGHRSHYTTVRIDEIVAG
jgi:large subunit ribosomal protein L21